MTVLVALERADPDDVVVVDGRASAVGESTINLRRRRAGHRPRSRRGGAHPERERRGERARDSTSAGASPAFAELMNRKAAQLGLRDTHFVRPDGLDVAGHVSSARDVTKLARVAMNDRTVRAIVRAAERRGGRAHPVHLERPARPLPGAHRRQDRATQPRPAGRRWRPRAGAASPSTRRSWAHRPARRGTPTSRSCSRGASRGTASSRSSRRDASTRVRRLPYGKAPVALVAARGAVKVVRDRAHARGARRRPDRRSSFRSGRASAWESSASTTGATLLATRPLVAARSVAEPGRAEKVGWYAEETLRNVGGLFS